MSQPELDRVRQDLATMKRAVGLDLSFDRADVWRNTGVGFWGALTAFWVGFGPQTYPLWMPLLWLPLCVGPGLWMKWTSHHGGLPRVWATRQPAARKIVWTVAMVAVLLFLRYATAQGIPKHVCSAVVVFAVSAVGIGEALTDRTRRHYLGFGIPGLLTGIALLFCSDLHAQKLAAAVGIALFGVTTAGIQIGQLWTRGRHAGD